MSGAPVQVIVAAFSSPTEAGAVMDELKQGKKEGLIGIVDAAVVVKDAEGKLKVTDARRRSRRTRGLLTGGLVGGLVGLLAGPVGWAALGGGAVGALAARLRGQPMQRTMEGIGESLTPNSSAIVAVVEHTWVPQLREALAAQGARVAQEALMADIANQLQAGGNVLYTAVAGESASGIARVAEGPDGARVSGLLADDEGVSLIDAQLTDEEPEEEAAAGQPAAELPAPAEDKPSGA